MLRELINHSPDLKRLQDDGYKLELRDAYLLVQHIPYVNSSSEIEEGVLVTDLELAGNKTTQPKRHEMHFIGQQPCDKNGKPLPGLQLDNQNRNLTQRLQVNRNFSNKPKPDGYKDYYHKITRYIEIISAPAMSMDASQTARVYDVIEASNEESVFHYIDTNSSRADIGAITEKLKDHKIGIIGLGGTGSYVLDQIAKTPVKEIHLFDGDRFLQHNAFRSPGAPSIDLLEKQLYKTEYFEQIYSRMHKGIHSHEMFLHDSNLSVLEELDFVFLCINKGAVKKKIIDYMIDQNIPVIDVGLDVNIVEESLISTIRSTLITTEMKNHVSKRISLNDRDDDEYAANIQIADLNAFNAILAVMKWKKYLGFYQDLEGEFTSIYTTNDNEMYNEDHKT